MTTEKQKSYRYLLTAICHQCGTEHTITNIGGNLLSGEASSLYELEQKIAYARAPFGWVTLFLDGREERLYCQKCSAVFEKLTTNAD